MVSKKFSKEAVAEHQPYIRIITCCMKLRIEHEMCCNPMLRLAIAVMHTPKKTVDKKQPHLLENSHKADQL